MLTMLKRVLPRTVPVLVGYLFWALLWHLHEGKWLWRGVGAADLAGDLWRFHAVRTDCAAVSAFFPGDHCDDAPIDDARHIFYGLSMLDKYERTGKWKLYLIFSLSDETYSLVVAGMPDDLPEDQRGAWSTAMSALGGILGSLLPMAYLMGIDFAVTALLHLWKRRMILSICGGTAVYMVLQRLMGAA